MFDNPGYKLKVTAKVFCWIGIIASVIGGIVLMTQRMVPVGIITIVAGTVSSWVAGLGLYGYGEIVENSDIRTNIAAKHELEKK